jgi:hypothetical protein
VEFMGDGNISFHPSTYRRTGNASHGELPNGHSLTFRWSPRTSEDIPCKWSTGVSLISEKCASLHLSTTASSFLI